MRKCEKDSQEFYEIVLQFQVVLRSKLEVTEKNANEYQMENAVMKTKLAEKEHLSAHA